MTRGTPWNVHRPFDMCSFLNTNYMVTRGNRSLAILNFQILINEILFVRFMANKMLTHGT
jgi:hypothetical protein